MQGTVLLILNFHIKPGELMFTLATQLLSLVQTYPELSLQIEPIIASVVRDASMQKTALVKNAGKLKEIMGGSSIFGLKFVVAKRIDKMLDLYDLEPYAATLSFQGSKVSLLVSASQKKGHEPLSAFAAKYIGEDIAQDLKSALGYQIVGTGSYSTFSDSVLFKLTQRLG